MTSILAALQAIFTSVMDMAGDVIQFIMKATTESVQGNELLLLFVLIPLIGIGVGMVTRLIRARG